MHRDEHLQSIYCIRLLLLKLKSKLWIVLALFISFLVCPAITSEASQFKLRDDKFEEIKKKKKNSL